MKSPRRSLSFAPVVLLALAVSLASCSNKPTTPGGGGGGGGGTKELDSGNILNGGIYQHTFASAGTFEYLCTIHPVMRGTVTVAAGQPSSVAVAIADLRFTPASVSVAPGGTVTWTNNGPSTHTVTSTP